MKSNVDLETLEKFCEGRMTKEEKEAFELILREDPGVAATLKNYLLSKSAISAASDDRLKMHLDEIGKGMENFRHKPYIYVYLRVAAVICLLIGIGWFMTHFFGRQKSTQQLYLAYYHRPELGDLSVRSLENDSSLVIWQAALDHYNKHEIKKASIEFGQLLHDQNTIPVSSVHFILAICYMELNQQEKASRELELVRAESDYALISQYYKALCYIEMNKTNEAIGLLQQIANNREHPNNKDARRILRELK
jgi:hypothetical protein